jgi:hypothetical protein
MKRTETVCPRCRQVNARYSGAFGPLLNPPRPRQCAICSSDLLTGQRDAVDVFGAVIMWTSVYVVHAAAGAGAFMLAFFFLCPGFIDWHIALRTAPFLLGAAVGVHLAERSRRRGELLDHPNQKRPADHREAGEQGIGPNERRPG